MKNQDFTAAIAVDKTAEEAFAAIINFRGWWCENIEGNTDKLNEEFVYDDGGLWCRMKLTELVPGKRAVWHVLESEMSELEGGKEWNGTDLIFDITAGDKTRVRFTHAGLVPGFDCYNVCSRAWTYYITNSLKGFITEGKGDPIRYKPGAKS